GNISNERKRPRCENGENVQEFSFPKRIKGELRDQKSEIGPPYKFENQYIPSHEYQHIYFDHNINGGNLNRVKNILLTGRVKVNVQNQMSWKYNNSKTRGTHNMKVQRCLDHNETNIKSSDAIVERSLSSHPLNKKENIEQDTSYKNGYYADHSFKKNVQHAWGI
ncbi:7196_t:CDS:2, partial [Racocetra persica]